MSEGDKSNIPVSAKGALRSELGSELKRIYSELIALLKKSALPFTKAAKESKEGLEDFVGWLLDQQDADKGIEKDEDEEDSEEEYDPKAKKQKLSPAEEAEAESEEEESVAASEDAETSEEEEEESLSDEEESEDEADDE
jgi:hypothetical protein